MAGINKVILVGNLGAKPEIKYASNGNAISNLSVATSESWTDKNTGQKQERTEWHRVSLFGKVAEIAGQYLDKGSKVYVEGKLKTRKWQDDSGSERYSTEIHCTEFTFLTPKNESSAEPSTGNQQMSQNRPAQQQQPATQSPGSRNEPYNQTEEEDDLPF